MARRTDALRAIGDRTGIFRRDRQQVTHTLGRERGMRHQHVLRFGDLRDKRKGDEGIGASIRFAIFAIGLSIAMVRELYNLA